MLLDRLKLNVARSLIFTTEDGRVVFYPYGPFRGFLLPDAGLEAQLANSINRHHTGAFWSCLILAIVGPILRIEVAMLFLIGLLDYTYCFVRIRRMTRGFVELPRGLSARLYASLQPTEKLWERFYQAAIGSVMLGVVALLPQAPPILWVGFAGFLAIASVWAYLLMVHRRETSPALQPSSGNRDSG